MIIGTIHVNEQSLVRSADTVERFCEYCKQLVPEEYRHVQAIVENQQYYCCLLLRRLESISWSRKREIINGVMRSIRIVGYTDSLVEATSLAQYVNVDRLRGMKERCL